MPHRRAARPWRCPRGFTLAAIAVLIWDRRIEPLDASVGKVAIPDAILAKAGPLDEDEEAFMRRHTVIGEAIIAEAPALQPVAQLVHASHERWDGGGYPDGLAGEAIPLGARIVAVCDAVSAMRQQRPYGVALSESEALDVLRDGAGS